MATVLSLTLFLALIGAGMPVSLLSMIWGEISENMIFAASMAGALRAALAFGAVLACIFEGRVREKVGKIDLLIVGMLFEALSLVGYSLSRLFGHLMVWSLLEGFGSGLVLIDVCLILSVCTFRRTALIFTGSPLGIAAGAFVLSFLGERDLSWRTKCQLSGFLILFVTVAVFYLRRRYRLSDFGTKLQKCSGDSTAPGTVQTVLFCGAGLLLGTLEAMTVLWSIAYPASDPDLIGMGISTQGGIILGCLSMAAGRLLAALLPFRKKTKMRLCPLLYLCTEACLSGLAYGGVLSMRAVLAGLMLAGAVLGPLLPLLASRDGEDRDDAGDIYIFEPGCRQVFPAFYLAGWVLITPLTAALTGSGQLDRYPLWLLIGGAVLAVLLFLAGRGLRKNKREAEI